METVIARRLLARWRAGRRQSGLGAFPVPRDFRKGIRGGIQPRRTPIFRDVRTVPARLVSGKPFRPGLPPRFPPPSVRPAAIWPRDPPSRATGRSGFRLRGRTSVRGSASPCRWGARESARRSRALHVQGAERGNERRGSRRSRLRRGRSQIPARGSPVRERPPVMADLKLSQRGDPPATGADSPSPDLAVVPERIFTVRAKLQAGPRLRSRVDRRVTGRGVRNGSGTSDRALPVRSAVAGGRHRHETPVRNRLVIVWPRVRVPGFPGAGVPANGARFPNPGGGPLGSCRRSRRSAREDLPPFPSAYGVPSRKSL
jgi:hypothetical protein